VKPFRLPDVLRALRHFDRMLPTDDDLEGIVSRRGRGAMLFDFYSTEDVADALERYGVAPVLRARGFSEIAPVLETVDPERQIVRVSAARDGRRKLLGEAILRDDEYATDTPFSGSLRGRRLHLLVVQWIRLQDPTRPFTPERPALPGQDHPGLGVGRQVMDMLLGLSARRGLAGIMVCPEFVHNAVIYSSQFRFFDPAAQGRFEALISSLEGLTLAEIAWGVETGCVTDSGKPFSWFHEEMIRPTGDLVTAHLESPAYADAARKERESHSYRFDMDLFRSMDPLLPDGSPRRK